jgi:predicted nucleic acid-binding protein
MITLDTSGIFALLNRRDPDHRRARAALTADGGPYLVPAGILAEVTYMIERTLHAEVLDAFLEDLQTGGFTLECGADDLGRVRALVRQYADLPLGFADAAVVGCAERHGGRVLTFDWRHFGVIASAGLVTVVPGQEE